MAAPRASSLRRSRPTVLVALALLGGLLPTVVLAVQPARAAGPSLQVSREITVTATDTATLTAKLSQAAAAATTIDFKILPAPQGQPSAATSNPIDTTCTIAAQQTSCQTTLISHQVAANDVRAWIDGTPPDTSEARLADKAGFLGLGGTDCTADDQSGGLLGGIGGGGDCENGTPVAGDTAEPDATDVISVQWTSFSQGHLNCNDSKGSDGTDVAYKNAAVSDHNEPYTCTLTTVEGVPIQGAFIDGEIVAGTNKDMVANQADYNDLCETDANGQCNTGSQISMASPGANRICFWAEPGTKDQQGHDVGQDNHYVSSGNAPTDGSDCASEAVDEPENNDITDSVYLDYDVPRAEGLDVQPENLVVSGASRFSLRATVYDQFGQPFNGNTILQAKLFPGSTLAPTADTNMANLDANLRCSTGTGNTCTILTDAQNNLGQNLACVWIQGQTPAAMTGQADQDSATCTAPKADAGRPAGTWESANDQEARVDPTNDDGVPSPPSDDIDVVRFAVQSRPAIFTVTPTDRRQSTTGDVLGIDGINFLPSALITVSGTGVTLGPTAVVSDKRLEASLAVAADAPAGARDVTVTNRSDGGTVTCAGCFRVIGQGYWMVASDGGIFNFGDAKFVGSAGSQSLSKPIVAVTPTPSGNGYWLAASDGGVFNYGDATFIGSAGALNLTKPIVSMAATPTGRGYWLVSSDGGVFGFGDAKFYGATSRLTLSKPIVSIVPTPNGGGYWLVASDGGIFGFGNAKFFGSTGDLILNQPIVAMAPTQTGKGYWLVAADGGIFAFGDATYYGSTGNIRLNKPIVGMTASPLGKGYWMVATDGGIFAFGDAKFFGSTGNITLNKPIVGIARR
ncbi:MAG TPA: hypothetical protein VGO87_08475 [Acidimicrobiia bacterium]